MHKLTNFVSEIDQFLQAFDQKNPKLSTSQKREKEKYQRIYRLRDAHDHAEQSPSLWEGF